MFNRFIIFVLQVLDLNNAFGITDLIWSCASGPGVKAKSWPTYKVNGYKFQTLEHCGGRKTMNSGVCVRGSNYGNAEADYYGLLEEIIELEYPCSPDTERKVVLFKCRWFDPPERGTRVHPEYRFVEINHNRVYRKYDPFILAQQALQVYYVEYPGSNRERANWWYVCKTLPRGRIDERWTSTAYQSDEIPTAEVFVQSTYEVDTPMSLRDPTGAFEFFDEEDMVEPDGNVDEDEELFMSPETSDDEGDYISQDSEDEDTGDEDS